mmetsp:Transcript_2131/g.4459  ORF Transcript_2131/g.4459 Transcript_2131/m.4459 type:complete len:356 (+) Transcript_2131:191-1258(+)|eukprot:6197287-Pleurochrysis_carterae.AAC.2
MHAVQATAFGNVKDVLTVEAGVPRPVAENLKAGQLLVRVLACSLSPSDWRTLSGDARLLKKPKNFPFIPGGDICGVVEAIGPDEFRFKVGDVVVSTWSVFGEGGLAEYCVIETSLTTHKPASLSAVEASAMANSPIHALQAIESAKITPGDRVLVLGGGGGMGTSLVQLAKTRGASFVATTCTDSALMASLGVDRNVDYMREQWDQVPEFLAKPFDVIIDCAEGLSAWKRACSSGVIKRGVHGGRFVAVVLTTWEITITQILHVFTFFVPVVCRLLGSAFTPLFRPRYKIHLGGPEKPEDLDAVFAEVQKGSLRPVVDVRSPHPFTTQGVRDAFNLLVQRKGHGKIVIQVAKSEK